ncbi:hypothetical protein [uncultured Bacteroides sp.]|uniref:hypothetical protein n=1 Tax=uncultured Bacteroides sp. TaxID=162156 RepID=UPI002637198F|nr:hypothetical protein [uncultured Bacteroides sp.]
MNTAIKTIGQLKDAEMSAYIYSIIVAVVFVLLLVIIANMISWKPGAKDNSGETRRKFFWILLALALIAPVVLNFVVFYQKITVAHFQSEFMMHMGIAGILSAVLYGVISFVIIRTQKRKTKLASIFPKKD